MKDFIEDDIGDQEETFAMESGDGREWLVKKRAKNFGPIVFVLMGDDSGHNDEEDDDDMGRRRDKCRERAVGVLTESIRT